MSDKVLVQKGKRDNDNIAHTRAGASAAGGERLRPLIMEAGNQEMQSLLRSGAIQAKLTISPPDDPLEREADRVADAVVQRKEVCACGGTCSKCKRDNEERIQLKRTGSNGAAHTPSAGSQEHPTAAPHNLLTRLGPGQPLDPTTRGLFESRMGHDFGATRIHTDSAAAEAAKSIGARAFTRGADVVFGREQCKSNTDAGTRLLAHELTHVVQQNGGALRIQRQLDGTLSPIPPATPASFDPCAVKETALTNAAFVQAMVTTRDYLAKTKRGEGAYYDYAHLWRRLEQDRQRRTELGHGWFANADLTGIQTDLLELIPGSGLTVHVAQAVAESEAGPPFHHSGSIVMTRSQFHDFLDKNNVKRLDLDDLLAQQEAKGNLETSFELPPSVLQRRSSASWMWPNDPFAPVSPFAALGGLGSFSTGPAPMFGAPWGQARNYDPFAPNLGGVGSIGASLYQPTPIDIALRPDLARQIYSSNVDMSNPSSIRGAETHWRGHTVEAIAQANLNARQLNDRIPNMRVYDLWSREGGPVSVTHSVLASGTPDLGFYDEKLRKATGDIEFGKLTRAVTDLRSLGYGVTVQTATDVATLAIPDDHLSSARAQLRTNIQSNPDSYERALDSRLRRNPIQVGSDTVSSWGQLTALRRVDLNTATVADLQRLSRIGPALAQRIVNERTQNGPFSGVDDLTRVRGIGQTTIGGLRSQASIDPVVSDHRFRTILDQLAGDISQERYVGIGKSSSVLLDLQQFRRGTSAISSGQMGRFQQGAPETFEMIRLANEVGGTGAATHALSHRTGVSGAKFGGTAAGAATLVQILYDPQSHSWVEVPVNVGLGAAEGYAGAYLQSTIAARTGQGMLGLATRMPALAGPLSVMSPGSKVVGGGLAGGVTAPAFTFLAMAGTELFTSTDFTYIDYTAKMARAATSGAIAGAAGTGGGMLGSALVGAALGSEVPIAGTIIGFGIGLLVFWLADKTIGEDVEESIREALGEYGCTGRRPPNPSSRSTSDDFVRFSDRCFIGGTRILMQDGTEKPIETMAIGEQIATFDETTGAMAHGTVQKLHQHGPAPFLEIGLENERWLRVTPAHRFYVDSRWIRAEQLVPGSRCLCVDPASRFLTSIAVTSIEHRPPAGSVFNLTVSKQHTYVAEGTIVHNFK